MRNLTITIMGFAIAMMIASPVQAGAQRIGRADVFHSADDSKVWTPPAATDTLVGRASTDTLTNKSIDGGTNTLSNVGDASLAVPYIKADGTRAFTGDQSLGTHKITNVVDPVSAQDAATKNYVDTHGGTPNVVGSTASPSLISAAGGVSFSGTNYKNINFIAGNAGPVSVTANPQIAAGASVGQELSLIGESATNTVSLADGTGLALNGPWVGGLNSVLSLVWDGTNWVEKSRQ